MLYILGGAPRCGKSIISRELVSKSQIPYFCIDFLITAYEQVPALDIKHGQEFVSKAEKIWKISKPMISSILKQDPKYLIEGDGILPKHANELIVEFPQQEKVCFVGFTNISLENKLKQIRSYDHIDNWTKRYSDEEMSIFINQMITYSKYIEEECRKYNIKYFDCSVNFSEYLKDVVKYLSD